ncbi:MAG: hypothetical protein AAF558_14710 [Verrucomicrobiota bacterium]
MDSPQEQIKTATGYFELGMHEDAWEILESLPPKEKTIAPVLDLRLKILTALSQWALGEEIAKVLLHAGDEERKTVARFHHARGRAMWQSGDFDGARDQIRMAVEAWKDVRKELSDDDLEALFRD